MPEPRPYAQRREDTLALLSRPRLDGWLATVGRGPHVSPVPIAWHRELVVVALSARRPTARNLEADPRVRIAVGSSDDCVAIDAEVADRHTLAEMEAHHPDVLEAYVAQAGRTPDASDEVMLVIRPRRIQAWRGDHEAADRTLMHDGCWLVQPTAG